MPRAIFFLLLLLIPFAYTNASARTDDPPTIKAAQSLHVDSSKLEVRSFNAKVLDRYSHDKDFNYKEGFYQQQSLWSRFWQWFWRLLDRLFGNRRPAQRGPSYFEYVLVIAAVAFLIFVISKIIGIDLLRLFKKDSEKIDVPYSESLENIHEIGFDDEIEKAINQRNYRLAVRLLYLRCLKQLSDAQLIYWQLEKTNTTYLHELTGKEQYQYFGLLTRQFEYVWYGNFMIDATAFENINTLFADFKQKLP